MAAANIKPAIYSGIRVYEILCNGFPIMRRAQDHYVNATQILRSAGYPKTQRTKILERDIVPGPHEKVQGGYHMFQGTWVPLDIAIRLAKRQGCYEVPEIGAILEHEASGNEDEEFSNMLAIKKAIQKQPKPPKPPKEKRPPKEKDVVIYSTSTGESELEDENGEGRGIGIYEPHPGRQREPRRVRAATVRASTPQSSTGPSGSSVEKSTRGRTTSTAKNARSGTVSASPVPSRSLANNNTTTTNNTNTAHLEPPAPKLPAGPWRSFAEKDAMELMDPYGVLSMNSSSDDEYPYQAHRFSSVHRSTSNKKKRLGIVASRPHHRSSNHTLPYSAHDSERSCSPTSDESDDETNNNNAFGNHSDRCQGCGQVSKPMMWRKGPTGRRTLCDPCGVRWCFGGESFESSLSSSSIFWGLNGGESKPDPLSDANGLGDDSDSESVADAAEIMMSALRGTSPQLFPPTSNTTKIEEGPLNAEIQALRLQLKTGERERKRLRKILEEARRADAGADRAFRRAIVRCRRVRNSTDHFNLLETSSTFAKKRKLDSVWDSRKDRKREVLEEEGEDSDGSDDREFLIGFFSAVRGRTAV
ncbi:hypothetical protein HDV05_005894 [Chytridiales sp. JEL 0842]|nr:hypothetical protein HDV05_005894 [Chytridiales sp. JEL 0842]